MGGADASAAPLRPPHLRRSTHPREAACCPVGSGRDDRARRRRREGEGNKRSRRRFCGSRYDAADDAWLHTRPRADASMRDRCSARDAATRRRCTRSQRRRPRDDKRQPRCASRCCDAQRQKTKISVSCKTDPQRPARTRRRAPAAARTCFPRDGPSGVAVGGQRPTKAGVSDFFVGAAAPGGLRLPPPSPGSWRTKKNTHTTTNRRKATCGSRWGPAGGHGSDPLRLRPEFSWGGSAGRP